MFHSKIFATALLGTVFAAAPAHAQLLGGSAGGGLGGAVSGALGGGLGNGSIVGNTTGGLTNAVTGSLNTSRSVDRRNGSASANAGLVGSVSSVANAATGASGLGQTIGLAGSSSADGSASGNAGLGVQAIGTDQVANSVGAVRERTTTVAGNAQGRATSEIRTGRDRASALAGTVMGSGNASASGSANGTAIAGGDADDR